MRLIFVGDVMLGRLVNQVLKVEPPEYPWGGTLPIFREADFRICNLECVVSDRGSPWSATPKMFHFRTDAKNVEVLKRAKINAVSLANNHALDFEDEALLDCIDILDRNGIVHAGAGANRAEAERPAIAEVGGIRIGMIAFTDNEPDWEATESQPGVYYVPIDPNDSRAKRLMSLVEEIRGSVDMLIVSTHWGPNWGYDPLPEHVDFAHRLIASGADTIFGHSPHIFRGIEVFQGKPILYSTGNFIDDYAVDEVERNDQSCIFTLETAGVVPERLILYPTVIDSFQAVMATGAEADVIVRKMQRLCRTIGTEALTISGRLEIPLR